MIIGIFGVFPEENELLSKLLVKNLSERFFKIDVENFIERFYEFEIIGSFDWDIRNFDEYKEFLKEKFEEAVHSLIGYKSLTREFEKEYESLSEEKIVELFFRDYYLIETEEVIQKISPKSNTAKKLKIANIGKWEVAKEGEEQIEETRKFLQTPKWIVTDIHNASQVSKVKELGGLIISLDDVVNENFDYTFKDWYNKDLALETKNRKVREAIYSIKELNNIDLRI